MTRSTRSRKRSAGNAAPTSEIETYQVGDWKGIANYGCPFCEFRTLAGTAEVVAHIAFHHRDQAIAQAEQEAS